MRAFPEIGVRVHFPKRKMYSDPDFGMGEEQ